MLGRDPHGSVQVGVVLAVDRMGTRLLAGHGHIAHGFDARADDHVAPPGHDTHGAEGDGLEPRGAEAVDRGPGHVFGESDHLGRDAADVQALFGLGKGTPHHDVVHILLLQVGCFFHGRVHDKGNQVHGQRIFKGAFGPLAARCADRCHNIGFSHNIPPEVVDWLSGLVFTVRAISCATAYRW